MESPDPAPPAGTRRLVSVTVSVTSCPLWEAHWSAVIAFISSLLPPGLRPQSRGGRDGRLSASCEITIAYGRPDVAAGRIGIDQARRSELQQASAIHDTDCAPQGQLSPRR